ncbi:MAG: glutamate 5-kinase, partial [Candidatus Syntropharchaeales archaeon]
EVRAVTPEIEAMADQNGSKLAVGGMITKINAAKICMEAGCDLIIANGRETDVIRRIVEGEEIGTWFCRKRT